MAVAVLNVHLPFGFFMNWYGSQKSEGFEYHLLAMALRGAGALSIDGFLARRFER